MRSDEAKAGENPLFRVMTPRPQAKFRWFVFPHAGGSAYPYSRWDKEIPAEVELVVLELPGRATRYKEPFYRDLTRLVDDLGNEIQPKLDLPYLILGHSMGALIGLELVRWLERKGCPQPEYLVASAHNAPTPELISNRPKIGELNEAEFLEQLKIYGDLPPEVLQHPSYLNFYLNILRADFKLLESFHPESFKKITSQILVLYGEGDQSVSFSGLQKWKQFTKSTVATKVFPGDHFYIFPQSRAVIDYLLERGDKRFSKPLTLLKLN